VDVVDPASLPRPGRPAAPQGSGGAGGSATPDEAEADHARTLDPAVREAARRRGVVAAAGHSGDEPTIRAYLADPAPAVRAAAFAALARSGRALVDDGHAAATDPDATVRRRACELAGALPGVDHRALLADPDPGVVEAAAFALGETGGSDDVAALVAVAGGHSDPLCRESAVAALGAIGDEGGLPAILAALDDKPAIRRRATLALAPFEGPEVQAALERSLSDRDWQVRQAAEDLLAGDA
jgi:HEAT repeat protein